jgi:L-ascorbate metabolism protein UlaG (beta-lactamase superfamily)
MERLLNAKVDPGRVAILWLGNGGFAFKGHAGDTIVVDPDLSHRSPSASRQNHIGARANCLAPKYVLLTHDHSHAVDAPTLEQMYRANPDLHILCPPSCCPMLSRIGIPTRQIDPITAGQHQEFPSFVAHAIPAMHTEDSVGYVLEFDEQDAGPAEVSVYITGHTGYDDGIIRAVADFGPDLLVLPINGVEGNMDAEDAARFAAAIAPAEVIPAETAPDSDRDDEVSRFESLLASRLSPGDSVATVSLRESACHLYCPQQALSGRHGKKKERSERARAARRGHQHQDGLRGPNGGSAVPNAAPGIR